MNIFKKIISVFIVIAIFISMFSISAFADTSTAETISLYKFLIETAEQESEIDKWLDGSMEGVPGCSSGHDHNFVYDANYTISTLGLGYVFRCTGCGQTYTQIANNNGSNYDNDYLTDADMDELYSHHAGKFPGSDTGVSAIDNSGRFIWYPELNNFGLTLYGEYGYNDKAYNIYNTSNSVLSSWDFSFNASADRFTSSGVYNSSGSFKVVRIFGRISNIYAPITGTYTSVVPIGKLSYTYLSDDNILVCNVNADLNNSETRYYGAGNSLNTGSLTPTFQINHKIVSFALSCSRPAFYVSPASAPSAPPINITNNITNVYQGNTTIVNPVNSTTMKLYDFRTGSDAVISSYTFDYASRTYYMVLEDGTLATVVYGTDCMTVTIGTDTQNYYYGYSECEPSPSHTHDWTPTVVNTRTCTQSGITTYSCGECGQTYTDVVPATGHVWDSGVLTPATDDAEAFYTFTCTICGETQIMPTNVPPSSGITQTNDIWWAGLMEWLTSFKADLTAELNSFKLTITGLFDDLNISIQNITNNTSSNEQVNQQIQNHEENFSTNTEGDDFTYIINENGEGSEDDDTFSFKDDFLAKFGIFKQLWDVGQYVVNIVSEDAANAYEFNINEALSIEEGAA